MKVLDREFAQAARPFLLYLATCIIWLSIFKDIVRVGFRPDWIAIRIGYLPFMLGCFALTERLTKRGRMEYSELPLWGAAIYITAFCTFFAAYTGGMASDSIYGLIQFYFGIAIMPITAISFYSILLLSPLAYFGLNYLNPEAVPSVPGSVISNLVPLFVFSGIVFFITSRIRKDKFEFRRQLEEELSQRQAVIVAQSEAIGASTAEANVGKIASRVAHDIRSPVGAIRAALRAPDMNRADVKSVLEASVARIQGIADELLRYRKSLVSTLSVDIVSLVRDVVRDKKFELMDRGIDIDCSFEGEAARSQLRVLIPMIDFCRMLSNFLNNAVDASQVGQSIHVVVTRADSFVKILIKDFGCGMPEDLVAKLMAGLSPTSRSQIGNGIGFQSARLIVLENKGSIDLSSKVSEGTVLEIRLPISV